MKCDDICKYYDQQDGCLFFLMSNGDPAYMPCNQDKTLAMGWSKRGEGMTREEIISGLKFTIEMFLFDPSTGEKYTEPRNDMDKTTIDACRGAIELLEQEPKTEKVIKMRDATPEEKESIKKYIKSISKPTGVDFDSLSDSQTIHHLTDKAYSELCLLAAKGRETLQPCEDAISGDAVLEKAVYTETKEIDRAYKQGYEDGRNNTEYMVSSAYKHGMEESWECARTIINKYGNDFGETRKDIFGYGGYKDVINNLTAPEAIAKIKEYEDKQKPFAVGDEVYSDAFDDKGIITHITDDKVSCVCIMCNGSTMMKVGTNGLHKTGRTFPQIAEVLAEMRGEKE